MNFSDYITTLSGRAPQRVRQEPGGGKREAAKFRCEGPSAPSPRQQVRFSDSEGPLVVAEEAACGAPQKKFKKEPKGGGTQVRCPLASLRGLC